MTNKEAIFYLKQVREDYEGKEFVEGKEALDLAIKSLKRVDCIYLKDECSFACGECGYCEAEKEGAEE